MHIVTGKKDVSATERLNQKDGLAVLGFFINVRDNMVGIANGGIEIGCRAHSRNFCCPSF